MVTKVNPNEPVTREMLNDAVDAILNGVDKLVIGLRAEMNGLRAEMKLGFKKLDVKIDYTKNELIDEIDGLKADLSDTPTKKEFEGLKRRVYKHHPL